MPATTELSAKLVLLAVPMGLPSRLMLYLATPTLSVAAVQLSATWPAAGVATRLVGAIGGVVSLVAVAVASFELGPMLAAASSALSW